MKKIISAIFLAFITLTIYAQSNTSYRLVIHQKNGESIGLKVENVDSLSFKKVEGVGGVDVQIHEINRDDPDNEYIVASFSPTGNCSKYRFTVVPKVTAEQYGTSVENMRAYFDGDETLPTEDKALDHAFISGFSFNLLPGIYYSVMVLSYDEFGVPCNAQTYDFQVPEVPLVGSPSVECRIDDATATTVTITFIPNADCAGYYACFFEPGLAEKQFKEFAPIMGFSCMGEMIKAFGQELHTEEFTITWDELAAGVPYEVYVQPLDANGNYAPMVNAIAETVKLGGEGLAEMSIELGALTYDSEYQSYFQEISFVPNDQTAAHRDIVAKKDAFDDGTWTEEKLVDYMKHDKNPDYPDFIEDPDWDKFGIHKGDFPVVMGKTYYVYSIGKNINGEYGPFVKKEFTVSDGAATSTVKNFNSASDRNGFVIDANAAKDFKLRNGKLLKKRMMIKM